MGKMFFGLISACCLSGFLIAHPTNYVLQKKIAESKEVMSWCLLECLRKNPNQPLTVKLVIADKPFLERQFSDVALDLIDPKFGNNQEKELVALLKYTSHCPVPPTPPRSKRKKIVNDELEIEIPSQSISFDELDCVVPSTPPKSPPTGTSRANQQIDRWHRQWKTQFKSDSNLQNLVRNDDEHIVTRRRTASLDNAK